MNKEKLILKLWTNVTILCITSIVITELIILEDWRSAWLFVLYGVYKGM